MSLNSPSQYRKIYSPKNSLQQTSLIKQICLLIQSNKEMKRKMKLLELNLNF